MSKFLSKEGFSNKENIKKAEDKFKSLTENLEDYILNLCSEEEKKQIEELKGELKWEKLPYQNIEELIRWINHPENVSKPSKKLISIIVPKVYDELEKLESKLVKSRYGKVVKNYIERIFQYYRRLEFWER